MKAYGETKDAEPHLNVRIHENTPGKLKKECIRLLARGNGQPTLYFDENIIPAMENSGVPRYDACRYANDGCTETVFDQKSGICFWQHEMVKTVELTLFNGEENPCVVPVQIRKNSVQRPLFTPHTQLTTGFRSGKFEEMERFEAFLDAFFAQLDFQLDCWRTQIQKKMEEDEKSSVTSPLIGGMFWKSVVTGKDPLRGGGFELSNYQLLSGTVTTAANCLRGVEESVFVQKWCTAAELKEALAADFEGWEPLRQQLLHARNSETGMKGRMRWLRKSGSILSGRWRGFPPKNRCVRGCITLISIFLPISQGPPRTAGNSGTQSGNTAVPRRALRRRALPQ